MEFEDVSEKMEWELRRVAAAFNNAGEWGGIEGGNSILCYGECFENWKNVREWVNLELTRSKGTIFSISVGDYEGRSKVYDANGDLHPDRDSHWVLIATPPFNERMARGLYCLGFDEAILSQLPPLSAHEKLELRLSMPREFWPKTWLDEGGE